MLSIGLHSTDSKTIAKVGHPFGCSGCTSSQPRPIRMGPFNSMPRVRSLHVKNPNNNYLTGSWVACCYTTFLSLSNIHLFSSGSKNFPDLQPKRTIVVRAMKKNMIYVWVNYIYWIQYIMPLFCNFLEKRRQWLNRVTLIKV